MKIAPQPKDVQDLIFKQSNINQILPNFASIPKSCNFLAADGKRGLLYLGHNNSITVIKPTEDYQVEWKTQLNVPFNINRMTLNCDCSYLAVTPVGPSAMIYDVSSLSQNLELLHEIRLSSNNIDMITLDFCWNPTIPGVFCTISSDHTIGSFQIMQEKKSTVGVTARERLNKLDVLCAAWSPKGKQIVVGCKDGCIVQLKPDLKIMRTIPSPSPGIGEVMSILWISNYQFCAAYYDPNEQRINVLIVDAPKGEPNAIFTCYEDITYGVPADDTNPQRYYFEYLAEWGIILAGSSGSSEIAVLGTTDNGTTWDQWQLLDNSRAQLPLVNHSIETYPVGIAIDKSITTKLPWGTESVLPHPVPVLNILGTSGQLCSFHMINLTTNSPSICNPPSIIVSSPPPQLPSDKSFALTIGATSTPKKEEPTTTTTPVERSKPPPASSLFPTPQPKPQPAPIKLPIKQDIKLIEKPKPLEQEKSTITDTNICLRAIFEQNTFEKELKSRLEPRQWNCGTQEESQLLAEKSLSIEQFLTELTETTNSLSNDIAVLKAILLQSFAWVEETRSKNISIDTNLQTCNIERSNKLKQLKTFYHYIESQLHEANKILDANWSKSQRQEEIRIKIPSLEYVYQTICLHDKIINQEKQSVEQLKKRLYEKTGIKINDNITLNESFSKLNLTRNEDTITTGIENPSIIETKCKVLALKSSSFTEEKENKLRNLLLESSPTIIRPMDTTVIHNRLEATLKSLATPTVVTKPSIAPIIKQDKTLSKPTVPIIATTNVVVTTATITVPTLTTITSTPPPSTKENKIKDITVPTLTTSKPMFPIILKTNNVDTTIKLPQVGLNFTKPVAQPIPQPAPVTTIDTITMPITIPTITKPMNKLVPTTTMVTTTSVTSVTSPLITLTNPVKTINSTPKTPFSGFFFTPTTTSAPPTPVVSVTATVAPTTSTMPNFMDSLMLSTSPKTTKITTPIFDSPIFETRTSTTSSLFGNVSTTPAVSSPGGFQDNVAEMSITPSMDNVFGKVSTPGSLFGQQQQQQQPESPMFGGGSTSGGNMFGGGTGATTNLFGVSTPSNNNFPTSPIFNNNSNNNTSFGGDSSSVFGSPQQQPVFGQQPAFGGKPVFGSPSSMFGGGTTGGGGGGGGGTTAFGSGFGGAATFGSNPLSFGNMPVMSGNSPLGTNKVFGGTNVGNPTFEHLAGQSGTLTFGSLAQTNPEPQKPPAFPGGSSFSNWR